MKALKSDLAKQVLADPKAKGQLRSYIATKTRSGSAQANTVIEVQTGGSTVRVVPVVVPKAA